MLRNYRDVQPLRERTVFHLAPGARDGFTLRCAPEQTCVATAGAARDGSVHDSTEGACTSLGQTESKAGVDQEGSVSLVEGLMLNVSHAIQCLIHF